MPATPVPVSRRPARSPELACYSDPHLIEALLDFLDHGNTAAADLLAVEVVARRLVRTAHTEARRRARQPARQPGA